MINDNVSALILGVVEGLTEFLPVSSTAHLRLSQQLLGLSSTDNFWKMFAVVIQFPAVLAVVFYFFPQIVKFLIGYVHAIRAALTGPGGGALPRLIRVLLTHPVGLVLIGTVVTGVPAALAKKLISKNLESVYVIGVALLVGGVVMWVVDSIYGKRERRLLSDAQAAAAIGVPVANPAYPPATEAAVAPSSAVDYNRMTSPVIVTHLEQMKVWQAVWIGLVQILSAVFPGTSRSMSTIAAGQIGNLTRAAALEFSFFMSIPLMFAACFFDLRHSLKVGDDDYIGHKITSHEIALLGIGSVVSFVVAFAVIAWFMAWVRRRGFVPFAIYRIVLGIAVLIMAARGVL